jgi:nucleoside-diphosphate-sugar epimerase
MKVLLTGASSFTGYWFAHALAEAGHQVVAPLRGALASYSEGTRAERVRRLGAVAEIVDEAPFGGARFMDLVRAGGYDLLCHHAARVGDYRSPDFDVAGALAENTHNLREVLSSLGTGGLKGVLLTGSVFEQAEGAGEAPRRAFSHYGVSKGLTAAVVEYRCSEARLGYGKFVIPNPFGPLEEPRFCAYLVRTWKAGDVARVNTPAYVRDNIHIDLLAKAYARYAGELSQGSAPGKLNPSGYVEAQGAFAERFAAAMRPRLGLPCALDLARQTEFSEPVMRVNTDSASLYVPHWNESEAWDRAAEAYRL